MVLSAVIMNIPDQSSALYAGFKYTLSGKSSILMTFILKSPQEVNLVLTTAVDDAYFRSHLTGALLSAEVFNPINGCYKVRVEWEQPEEGQLPVKSEKVAKSKKTAKALFEPKDAYLYTESDNILPVAVFETRTEWLHQPVVVKRYRSASLKNLNQAIQEAILQRKLESCHTCRLFNFSFDKPKN